jgi:hypothetical protein
MRSNKEQNIYKFHVCFMNSCEKQYYLFREEKPKEPERSFMRSSPTPTPPPPPPAIEKNRNEIIEPPRVQPQAAVAATIRMGKSDELERRREREEQEAQFEKEKEERIPDDLFQKKKNRVDHGERKMSDSGEEIKPINRETHKVKDTTPSSPLSSPTYPPIPQEAAPIPPPRPPRVFVEEHFDPIQDRIAKGMKVMHFS